MTSSEVLSDTDKILTLSYRYVQTRTDAPASLGGRFAELPIDSPELTELGEEGFSFNGERAVYTLRSDFSLDPSMASVPLSIGTVPTEYAYVIYLNGQRIFKTGIIGDRMPDRQFYVYTVDLPPNLLQYGNTPNQLAVEIYPISQPKALAGMNIGFTPIISQNVMLRNLIQAYIGCHSIVVMCFFFAFYFSITYFFFKKKQNRYLYFVLLNIFAALMVLNVVVAYDGYNQHLFDKISYSAYFWVCMVLFFFSTDFTRTFHRALWLKFLLIAVSAVLTALVFIQPNIDSYESLFTIGNYIYIMPLLLATTVLLVRSFIKLRRIDEIVLLLGMVMIFATAIHDSLFFSIDALAPYTWLNGYGYAFLLAMLFVVLSREQVMIGERVDILNVYMSKAEQGNLALSLPEDTIGDDITSINKNLTAFISSLRGFFHHLGENLEGLDLDGRELFSQTEQVGDAITKISTSLAFAEEKISSQRRHAIESGNTVKDMSESLKQLNDSLHNQQSRISESSTAIEQMIAAVSTISESTDKAATLVTSLQDVSQKGQNTLNEVSGWIREIASKSVKLEEANTFINDIADQTNLLAMNAAIEAAHAGTQGRGFAVVATEIRKLAEEATHQSRIVAEIIKGISGSIAMSVQRVTSTTQQFEQIMKEMGAVNGLVRSIDRSIQEQSAGNNQVLSVLAAMHSSTEEVQNATQLLNSGSSIISENVNTVNTLADHITTEVTDIRQSMDWITSSVAKVQSLTQENKEKIEKVRKDASYYKQEGEN